MKTLPWGRVAPVLAFTTALLLCALEGSAPYALSRLPREDTCMEHSESTAGEQNLSRLIRWVAPAAPSDFQGEPNQEDVADYDPATDTVDVSTWTVTNSGGGIKPRRRPAAKHCDDYKPFNFMVAWTNGGRDVDARGFVGFMCLRKQAVKGDLMCKGWFGSDEHDNLNFSVRGPSTKYLHTLTWPNCVHQGTSQIRQFMRATTRNVDISPHTAHAGTIKPFLNTFIVNRGVAGGGNKEGTVEYTQDETSAVVLQFKLEGGYSTGEKGGGHVSGEVSAGTTITTKTGYMNMQGFTTLALNGPATSPAENEIQNFLTVEGATNDHVVGWELSIENMSESLSVPHAH